MVKIRRAGGKTSNWETPDQIGRVGILQNPKNSLNSKTMSGVFSKDNNTEPRGFLESYMARDNRDKASPHLSVISQNKINQILKNNILFFLFFSLASEVFPYVLSSFFGTET